MKKNSNDFKYKICILVIFLVTSNFSIHVHASQTSEQDYLMDIPIVLSATRLKQPRRDAPASITTISRRMIDASGAIDIAELLRFVPGFQVSMVNGNLSAVTSHGLAYQFPRNLQVLIDGRSVYRPLLSNVDWANLGISLKDIDYIEVVRGPSATVYGMNAFLGTINIITQQPFDKSGYSVEMLSGSRGTNAGILSYANSSTNLSYLITTEFRKDDGFDQVNDERNIKLIFSKLSYDITKSDSIDAQSSFSLGKLGAWGKSNSIFNRPREKQVTAYHGMVRWNKRISTEEDFYLQFYHNYYEQSDSIDYGLLSTSLGVDPNILSAVLDGRPDQSIRGGVYDGSARRTDIEAQHTYQFNDELRVVWGASYRSDKMKSLLQLDHNNYVSDTIKRLFGNVESIWNDKIVLNVGAMIEENGITNTKISPRIGINYHLDDSFTVRLNSTKAYRTPSLYEQYNKWRIRLNDNAILKTFYDTEGDLSPEIITSHEVGLISIFPRYDLIIDLKMYIEKIQDIIVAPLDRQYVDSDFNLEILGQNQGAKVWQNNGYSNTKGFEMELQYNPANGSLVHLAYAYADISGRLLEERNPDNYKKLSNHAPKHTFSGLFQYSVSTNWKASTSLYYLDKMTWNGAGDEIDQYQRIDIKIQRDFRLFGLEADAAAIVHNVFNQKYNEFSDENIFQRYGYFQFKMSL